jgi:hypothetical protein
VRRTALLASALLSSALALSAACSTDLGDLPALCPDGLCPEGYDCINGVCALPGTVVPITVVTLGNLRDGDLQLVAEDDAVLVVWETYPYSELGQAIVARRLELDGTMGEHMLLDDSWQADPGAVEPFFSVTSVEPGKLLLAITSGPIDDDPRPRMRVFSVDVSAGGGASDAVWPNEVRMATIGYGNVSQPRFVAKPGGGLELGYFAGVASTTETIGRLAVFDVDDGGALLATLDSCDGGDPACCSAHRCYDSARTEGIAAGVEQAFHWQDRTVWAIDKTRPSCLITSVPLDGAPDPGEEVFFDTLSLPLASDSSDGLVFLAPSPRTGDKLPNAPASGPAHLRRSALAGGDPVELGELPVVRDAPRAAWAPRDETHGYLVSPGELVDAPSLRVLDVDTTSGAATEVAVIDRISSLEIGSVTAALVSERLFVVWLEVANERAVIRAVVLPAP